MAIDYNMLAKRNILHLGLEVEGMESDEHHTCQLDCIATCLPDEIVLYGTSGKLNQRETKPFARSTYRDIDKVNILVCKRNYGKMKVPYLHECRFDMLVNLKNGKSYQFESQSWELFVQLIDKLIENDVKVVDTMNIYSTYIQSGYDGIEMILKDDDNTLCMATRNNNIR